MKLSAQKYILNLKNKEYHVKGFLICTECCILDKISSEWINQGHMREFENEGERIIKYLLGKLLWIKGLR